MARQLTTFTGLCTLRNLDLDHVGINEIFCRHTETARCYLLDRRAFRVWRTIRQRIEPIRLLAAFTRVRLAANAVHGTRKRSVCFARDGTERHGTGREPLDDIDRRFNLVNGHWLFATTLCKANIEQATNGLCLCRLGVEHGSIFGERFRV